MKGKVPEDKVQYLRETKPLLASDQEARDGFAF
jgi:hypothetical protein